MGLRKQYRRGSATAISLFAWVLTASASPFGIQAAFAQTSGPLRRLRFESAPAPNSVVQGTVSLNVSADPSFQPAGVVYEILLDGAPLGQIAPPAAFAWDTTRANDGKRILQLVRRIPGDGKTFRETYREEIPVQICNSGSSAASSARPTGTASQFTAIDNHALVAPPDEEQSPEKLAAYLTASAKSDLEKTRAIYRWVASRIRWGAIDGVNPGQPMDARPSAVLSRRTAECLGYATLFERLARLVGLEAVSIQGYVRTDASTVEQYAADPARFNHWWNAVKLDGQWKLLDCGWSVRGADGTTAGSAQGPLHLESRYFLTPPEELVFTHFPLDPKWQLGERTVTLDEQKRLAYPRPEFFALGLSILALRAGMIPAPGGRFTARIGAPNDVVMSAVLASNGRQIARSNASERQNGFYVFAFARIEPGLYRLTLFAKKRSDPGVYHEVLNYTVNAVGAE